MENVFIDLLPPWVETGLQPAFYDKESGTVLQQTTRMYAKVNQVVETVNQQTEVINEYIESFNNLYDYVYDYFDNLDVQEEVNNKLNEMAEDGTLERIIYDGFLNVSSKLTPEYIMTRYIACQTDNAFDATIPSEQEGICYIGNSKFITFFSPHGNGIGQNTDVIIEEYNISIKGNPQRIRTSTISGLKHANTCVYQDNKIYVTPSQYYDGENTQYTNTIVEIGYTDLSISNTHVIENLPRVTNLANDEDGNLYTIYNGNLYSIDLTTHLATLIHSIDIVGNYQGFVIKNGNIYLMQPYPYQISVYEIATGELKKILALDEYDSEGHFSEYCSDLTLADDSNLLITPHAGGDLTNDTSKYQWAYYINYVCKVNIFGCNQITSSREGNRVAAYLTVNTDTPENTYYAIGTNDAPLKIFREYQRNKLRTVYNYRLEVTSTRMVCYGILLLENENLYSRYAITCYGLILLGSTLYAPNIRNYVRRMLINGSTLSAQYINEYSEADNHAFTYSTILCPNINNGNGTNRIPVTVHGSQLDRWENTYILRDECPNAYLTSTLDKTDENVCVADFSSKITTNNFNPSNYLIGISLSNGEEVVFARTYGVGSNQKVYDHSGNEYQVMNYVQSTHKVTINSSNYNSIAAVTMMVM